MQVHELPGQYDSKVEIDFCFGCQGIWFDSMENLKLAPAAVAMMFKEMHRHRDTPHAPLAERLRCPQCRGGLVQGFDIVRSGRFITHRCEARHGRFSSFAAFMIEKGFVRQLTKPEIADIARKVGVISCSSCGAPVDLKREDACSHCRSALSLLDPQAVERAMETYANASARQAASRPVEVADALVAIARERSRSQRTEAVATQVGIVGAVIAVDLLSVGLNLLSGLWDD